MAKITWLFQNESGTNLNRYIATNVNTGEEITFDLLRGGNISIIGTPLNAENMNSLVNAINGAYDEISEKLNVSQGTNNANKVAITNSQGNITFVNTIPSNNLPSTGVSVETAKNVETSSGNVISGDEIEKGLKEINDNMTATVECKHSLEITGNTGDEHNLAVEDQQMLLNKIQGQTFTVNQLNNNSGNNSGNYYGVQITKNNDGSYTFSGTSTSIIYFYLRHNINIISNHQYLILSGSSNENIRLGLLEKSSSWSSFFTGLGGVYKHTKANAVVTFQFTIFADKTFLNVKAIPQLIDLTQWFGAGNEPTTVEEFYSKYNGGLIPHNEGTFKHSNCNLISTGRNLWNGEWELGAYDGENDGAKIENSNSIRSKNFIKVLPNQQYYLKVEDNKFYTLYQYDINKNYIQASTVAGNSSFTFETDSNIYFITFDVADKTTYNNNICINVSDTNFNGAYEPYKEEVISGIGELKEFDFINNVSGKKVLASKELTINSSDIKQVGATYTNITYFTFPKPFDYVGRGKTSGNIITNKYQFATGGNWDSTNNIGYIFQTSTYNDFWIGFPKGTTLEEAQAQINGLVICYEIITPIEEEINLPAGYSVYKNGYQIQNGEVPYILAKEYALNLKAQVLANIEIDREQQSQINVLKEEQNKTNEEVSIMSEVLEIFQGDIAKLQNKYGIINMTKDNTVANIDLSIYKDWEAIIGNSSVNSLNISFSFINSLGNVEQLTTSISKSSSIKWLNGVLLITNSNVSQTSYVLSNTAKNITISAELVGQVDNVSIYWKAEY